MTDDRVAAVLADIHRRLVLLEAHQEHIDHRLVLLEAHSENLIERVYELEGGDAVTIKTGRRAPEDVP